MADLTRHVVGQLEGQVGVTSGQVHVALYTLSSANKLEAVAENAVFSCARRAATQGVVVFHEAEKYLYDHISAVLFGERKMSTLYAVVTVYHTGMPTAVAGRPGNREAFRWLYAMGGCIIDVERLVNGAEVPVRVQLWGPTREAESALVLPCTGMTLSELENIVTTGRHGPHLAMREEDAVTLTLRVAASAEPAPEGALVSMCVRPQLITHSVLHSAAYARDEVIVRLSLSSTASSLAGDEPLVLVMDVEIRDGEGRVLPQPALTLGTGLPARHRYRSRLWRWDPGTDPSWSTTVKLLPGPLLAAGQDAALWVTARQYTATGEQVAGRSTYLSAVLGRAKLLLATSEGSLAQGLTAQALPVPLHRGAGSSDVFAPTRASSEASSARRRSVIASGPTAATAGNLAGGPGDAGGPHISMCLDCRVVVLSTSTPANTFLHRVLRVGRTAEVAADTITSEAEAARLARALAAVNRATLEEKVVFFDPLLSALVTVATVAAPDTEEEEEGGGDGSGPSPDAAGADRGHICDAAFSALLHLLNATRGSCLPPLLRAARRLPIRFLAQGGASSLPPEAGISLLQCCAEALERPVREGGDAAGDADSGSDSAGAHAQAALMVQLLPRVLEIAASAHAAWVARSGEQGPQLCDAFLAASSEVVEAAAQWVVAPGPRRSQRGAAEGTSESGDDGGSSRGGEEKEGGDGGDLGVGDMDEDEDDEDEDEDEDEEDWDPPLRLLRRRLLRAIGGQAASPAGEGESEGGEDSEDSEDEVGASGSATDAQDRGSGGGGGGGDGDGVGARSRASLLRQLFRSLPLLHASLARVSGSAAGASRTAVLLLTRVADMAAARARQRMMIAAEGGPTPAAGGASPKLPTRGLWLAAASLAATAARARARRARSSSSSSSLSAQRLLAERTAAATTAPGTEPAAEKSPRKSKWARTSSSSSVASAAAAAARTASRTRAGGALLPFLEQPWPRRTLHPAAARPLPLHALRAALSSLVHTAGHLMAAVTDMALVEASAGGDAEAVVSHATEPLARLARADPHALSEPMSAHAAAIALLASAFDCAACAVPEGGQLVRGAPNPAAEAARRAVAPGVLAVARLMQLCTEAGGARRAVVARIDAQERWRAAAAEKRSEEGSAGADGSRFARGTAGIRRLRVRATRCLCWALPLFGDEQAWFAALAESGKQWDGLATAVSACLCDDTPLSALCEEATAGVAEGGSWPGGGQGPVAGPASIAAVRDAAVPATALPAPWVAGAEGGAEGPSAAHPRGAARALACERGLRTDNAHALGPGAFPLLEACVALVGAVEQRARACVGPPPSDAGVQGTAPEGKEEVKVQPSTAATTPTPADRAASLKALAGAAPLLCATLRGSAIAPCSEPAEAARAASIVRRCANTLRRAAGCAGELCLRVPAALQHAGLAAWARAAVTFLGAGALEEGERSDAQGVLADLVMQTQARAAEGEQGSAVADHLLSALLCAAAEGLHTALRAEATSAASAPSMAYAGSWWRAASLARALPGVLTRLAARGAPPTCARAVALLQRLAEGAAELVRLLGGPAEGARGPGNTVRLGLGFLAVAEAMQALGCDGIAGPYAHAAFSRLAASGAFPWVAGNLAARLAGWSHAQGADPLCVAAPLRQAMDLYCRAQAWREAHSAGQRLSLAVSEAGAAGPMDAALRALAPPHGAVARLERLTVMASGVGDAALQARYHLVVIRGAPASPARPTCAVWREVIPSPRSAAWRAAEAEADRSGGDEADEAANPLALAAAASADAQGLPFPRRLAGWLGARLFEGRVRWHEVDADTGPEADAGSKGRSAALEPELVGADASVGVVVWVCPLEPEGVPRLDTGACPLSKTPAAFTVSPRSVQLLHADAVTGTQGLPPLPDSLAEDVPLLVHTDSLFTPFCMCRSASVSQGTVSS